MSWANLTAVVASAALGILAWGGPVPGWVQGTAILMPVFWASTSNRWAAGLAVMAYTTAASRGLIPGIAEFFGTDLLHGLALWLVAGVLPGLVGVICWHRSQVVRAFLIPVLLLLLIVPPAGLVGWANPLTAAGWIFPGAGWLGLVATVSLAVVLAIRAPLITASCSAVPLLALCAGLAGPVDQVPGWEGHDTHFRFGVGAVIDRNPQEEIRRHWALQSKVAASDAQVQVFPETVGGVWNAYAGDEWHRLLMDLPEPRTVLVGAYEPLANGDYNNVLMEISEKGATVAYRQRSPIPVGMWTPWKENSAVAHWRGDGVIQIGGRRVGVMLCYEALLVWPVLLSITDNPDLLISIASTWWAPESIHLSQQHAMQAWARLFSLPLVEAYNL